MNGMLGNVDSHMESISLFCMHQQCLCKALRGLLTLVLDSKVN